jgi:predicted P-loop ATPase
MSEGFIKVEEFINENFIIRYNTISNEFECKNLKESNSDFNSLNENNIYRLLKNNHININLANLYSLLKSDFIPLHNPFTDYFNQIEEWDSETDHIGNLCEKIRCRDQSRFNQQFKKMLVRTVACALVDGIFNKQALILVHDKQNSGKSTFCRWLCPPKLKDYITENIGLDKDSMISLAENFIINLDELATLSKLEINHLKSVFSKVNVKIRRPYERRAATVPRRASFFGSTNNKEFLTDNTGSVRWLCFEIEEIDWTYTQIINIDSIWSQAYYLFKNGFKYELSQDEIYENEKANKQFQVVTTEMELIQKYFYPGVKEEDELMNATEVMDYITSKHPNTIKINQIGIGKALKGLGFIQGQVYRTEFEYQVKGYYIKKIT